MAPLDGAMMSTRLPTCYDGNASAGAWLELDRHADQRGIELHSDDRGTQADDHAVLIFQGSGVSLAGQLRIHLHFGVRAVEVLQPWQAIDDADCLDRDVYIDDAETIHPERMRLAAVVQRAARPGVPGAGSW